MTLIYFNEKDKQFVDWFPENPFKMINNMQEKIDDHIQEEKFKKTEIDLIPEKWEAVRLRNVAEIKFSLFLTV